MEKVIKITGVGTASQSPDKIIVSVNLSTLRVNSESAAIESQHKVEAIDDILKKLKFPEKALKTNNYSVQVKYNRTQNEKGIWQSKFAGYECNHSLFIEMGLDMKQLSLLIDNLNEIVEDDSIGNDKVNIKVDFTIEDKEKMKEVALTNAVMAAQKKANLITKAAHVLLGDIISIEHSFGTVKIMSNTSYDSPPRYEKACMSSESINMSNINPADITITDNVTITWSIK